MCWFYQIYRLICTFLNCHVIFLSFSNLEKNYYYTIFEQLLFFLNCPNCIYIIDEQQKKSSSTLILQMLVLLSNLINIRNDRCFHSIFWEFFFETNNIATSIRL